MARTVEVATPGAAQALQESVLPARLIKLAGQGNEAAIDEWLSKGGSVDAKYEQHDGRVRGLTMLMAASIHGQDSAVRNLLRNGAETDLVTNDGMSALMGACLQGHPKVVELLLNAEANTELKALQGATALHLAESKAENAATGSHANCARLITESLAQRRESKRQHRRLVRSGRKLPWMKENDANR